MTAAVQNPGRERRYHSTNSAYVLPNEYTSSAYSSCVLSLIIITQYNRTKSTRRPGSRYRGDDRRSYLPRTLAI